MKEEARDYIESLMVINKKQSLLLNDFIKKISQLSNNKNLITRKFSKLSNSLQNVQNNKNEIEKLSLKMQCHLLSTISGIEKLNKEKFNLLQRESIALSQFKQSLEEHYKILRGPIIKGNIQNTALEQKLERITNNIFCSMQKISHSIELAAYSKKLMLRLSEVLEAKKNVSLEQLDSLKKFSILASNTNSRDILEFRNLNEKIADTSLILEELNEQLSSQILCPLKETTELRKNKTAESFNFLSSGRFSISPMIINKKDVLLDMRKMYSEKELNLYISELKSISSVFLIDVELKQFIDSYNK